MGPWKQQMREHTDPKAQLSAAAAAADEQENRKRQLGKHSVWCETKPWLKVSGLGGLGSSAKERCASHTQWLTVALHRGGIESLFIPSSCIFIPTWVSLKVINYVVPWMWLQKYINFNMKQKFMLYHILSLSHSVIWKRRHRSVSVQTSLVLATLAWWQSERGSWGANTKSVSWERSPIFSRANKRKQNKEETRGSWNTSTVCTTRANRHRLYLLFFVKRPCLNTGLK